ncbi:MAG: PQQ-dependent sugar dehydrogenase, partial [Armatimonadetes bacterium]|nr:PQQ-dependent sugar dehydrogenase [Akkermansiaceae bacterium]
MHPKTLAPVKSNSTKTNSRTWLAVFFTLGISSFALAVETSNQANTVSGGELAIAQMEVTPGLKVSLFADESLISHPVAFCADEKGRFFVAESFRFMEPNGAWSDIRPRMDWLDEDLACRNLEDRQKLYLSRLGPKISEWKQLSERIRLIEDRDRDGKADHASVFAEGFNDILDGTAAGIMARKGTVWFTCIPSLWQLRESAGSGKADLKKSLHRGFGVRLGYLGHDLHGLCIGPDGKLYFSIGDRGTYIEKDVARVVDLPDTGAVFRCNQNGSNLEVFATGLRNPQELAFDKFGNLWTCDNNADHGDKARGVYVVEGGDSGWRVGFQHVTYPIVLGPWNSEKLWHPSWKGQSAAIVPPIANFAQGPSGVAYYPGTGMGAEFEDKFLVCDFLGDNGGIHSLSVQPKGASFELTGSSHFVWRIPATDVEFGPDGSVYACTWNGNVDAQSLAYIYKISNPLSDVDTQVSETQRLLAEGMSRRSDMELAKWLDHKDMRIRREAQFGLVERGLAAVTTLEKVLPRPETLPRLHALWGLGQIATKFPKQRTRILKSVIAALEYPDLEVQTQAAKVLGDTGHQEAFDPLADLLSGTSAPRVRFFAAQSLGKLG